MLEKLLLWPCFTLLLLAFLLFWFAIGAFQTLARLLDRWSIRGL